MVYDINKKNTTTIKETPQKNADVAPAANTSALHESPSKSVDTTTDSSYTPGGNIDSTKTGLVDAANNLKIQSFADAAQKHNAQPTASDPNDIDYAAEMQKVLALPQTPENQQKMQALTRGRNLKIALNPDAYGQYADDPYAKAAEDYLSYISPEAVNTQKHLDSMYANAGNRYQTQMDLMQQQHDVQSKTLAEKYEKLRNQEFVNAARRALGTEEVLAAQGLGRGISNAPSSGFGESSRMMAQTSLNNNLANAYLAEQKALEDLRNQLTQNQMQAYMDHADRMNSIDLQALGQANSDRDYNFNVQNANIGNNMNRDVFNWQIETDARDFGRNMFESDRSHAENVRQFDALNELNWYNAKNKGSGGSGYYNDDGQYTFVDSNGSNVPNTQPTMTDAEAGDYVRRVFEEEGKTNAIYTLAHLRSTGQISESLNQMLIDELGLAKSDGWLY